jgi:hypothetical protein
VLVEEAVQPTTVELQALVVLVVEVKVIMEPVEHQLHQEQLIRVLVVAERHKINQQDPEDLVYLFFVISVLNVERVVQ